MQLLRTNTATRVTVGPIYDTDGLTPKTVLTVTGLKLSMTVDDGGVPTLVLDTAPTASGGANDMVHITGDDSGFFDLELAAANVNYLGRAKLALSDPSNMCPVFHEYLIVPAVVYDALLLGTDLLQVDLTQVVGATTNVAALATNVDAIKTKTDALPSDPADASDVAASFSTVNTTLSTIAGYLDTEIAAIKAKTDNLPSDPADASDIAASLASLASTLTTIAAYIDTEVASILAAVDTEVAAIKAKTDSLTFTVAGQADVNLQSINDVALTGTGVLGGEFGP